MDNKDTNFVMWLQSFTKAVVSIFSFLYVIIVIVMISMLMYQIHNGYSDGLSTMISEINETFRVVIGGYLIKAGVENGVKISGSYLSEIARQKLEYSCSESNDDNSGEGLG